MKLSDIRKIKEFCEDLHSMPSWREVVEQLTADETDFEVDNVRFIIDDEIDATLASELENDHYVLGCFNADFIAGIMGWPVALVEAAQKGEAYEALGEAIAGSGNMLELAKEYASADGYGHHFNHYDFGEEEITINGKLWHVFDNH